MESKPICVGTVPASRLSVRFSALTWSEATLLLSHETPCHEHGLAAVSQLVELRHVGPDVEL